MNKKKAVDHPMIRKANEGLQLAEFDTTKLLSAHRLPSGLDKYILLVYTDDHLLSDLLVEQMSSEHYFISLGDEEDLAIARVHVFRPGHASGLDDFRKLVKKLRDQVGQAGLLGVRLLPQSAWNPNRFTSNIVAHARSLGVILSTLNAKAPKKGGPGKLVQKPKK